MVTSFDELYDYEIPRKCMVGVLRVLIGDMAKKWVEYTIERMVDRSLYRYLLQLSGVVSANVLFRCGYRKYSMLNYSC